MGRRHLTEADIKALGGLSPRDRKILGIEELVALGIPAVKRFEETLVRGKGIRHWLETAMDSCRRLTEANSETALGFLLRKGVNKVANTWYEQADTKWKEYYASEGSDGFAEWYAPLYDTSLPNVVRRGQRFSEARIIGEDSVIVNLKFGQIVSVERELFDDDQTGQIRNRASKLGKSMGTLEEIWTSFRFLGSARTYANVPVPASGYSTTDINGTAVTTPFSASLYGTSSGNRLQTYSPLRMGFLKTLLVQCANAVDPLQNKVIVNVNRLLHSSVDIVNAQLLVAPGGYPAIVGQSDAAVANMPVMGGTSATAGTSQGVFAGYPGGWNSPNPLAGMGIKPVLLRYWPDGAWAIGEAGKGCVMQERDPLEIQQEQPGSGSWFDFDSIRWRSRRRFEAEWVGGGSRFWALGNDGTATQIQ